VEFKPEVLVVQDFHDSGGAFGADTGATARRLLAQTGWTPNKYQEVVGRLRKRVAAHEAEAGFFPPASASPRAHYCS
jgi:hypothetical protein